MDRRNLSDGHPSPHDGSPHNGEEGEAMPGEEHRHQAPAADLTGPQVQTPHIGSMARPQAENANNPRTGENPVNSTTLPGPHPAASTEAMRRQVQALLSQGTSGVPLLTAATPDSSTATSAPGVPAATPPLQQRQALLDLLSELVQQQSLAQSVVQLLQQTGGTMVPPHPSMHPAPGWTTHPPPHSPFVPSLGYSAMAGAAMGNPGANGAWNPSMAPAMAPAPLFFPPPMRGAPLQFPAGSNVQTIYPPGAAAARMAPASLSFPPPMRGAPLQFPAGNNVQTIYPPGAAAAASPWGRTTVPNGWPAGAGFAPAIQPTRRYKKRKYEHESFPEKLHRLLREAKEQEKEHIARFTDDGSQFQILNTRAYEEELLPRYFRHNRISSFKRLLRMYQFKRDHGTWMEGTFSHPLFHRDYPELCKQIQRIEQASA